MTTANVTEFESFARDLAVYACSWIPRCQNQIIKHAREIFEDKTLRTMVERYAELKAEADKFSHHEFIKACLGEDITEEEVDYIITAVKEVVTYLRGFSPIWRDLMAGRKEFIL